MGLCMRRQVHASSGSVEVLVLGQAAAGKTLLLRRLRELEDPPKHAKMATIPTVGVDLVTVDRTHKTIILREVGSSLSARWSLFYRNAGAFLYIVDGFDDTNIDAVRESLATVLDDSHMSCLPACVVFTKEDLDPEGINLATIKSTLGLDQLAQQRGEKLMTIVGSTVNHELAKKLMEWLENI